MRSCGVSMWSLRHDCVMLGIRLRSSHAPLTNAGEPSIGAISLRDFAHFDSAFLTESGATTGSSIVLEATFPSCHVSNEKVSFAVPKPASSGTRTGPWKRQPQQNLSSEYAFLTGALPGFFGGNSTSKTGKTPSGNADLSPL